MARARRSSAPEVSLFPFLSILACLIGALVLMIMAIVASTTAKTGGFTDEEIARSDAYRALEEETAVNTKKKKEIQVVLDQFREKKSDLETENRKLAQLRESEQRSRDQEKSAQERLDALQQKRDMLVERKDQIVKVQIPEHEAEIKRLEAEIAKLKVVPKAPPPVVVPPSGSGLPNGVMVYFIESGSGAINVMDKAGKSILRVPNAAITTDERYAGFLSDLQKLGPKVRLMFLLREDGLSGYNYGAGLAVQEYGIGCGKLPVPGKGAVDLKLFEKYAGPPVKIREPKPKPEA